MAVQQTAVQQTAEQEQQVQPGSPTGWTGYTPEQRAEWLANQTAMPDEQRAAWIAREARAAEPAVLAQQRAHNQAAVLAQQRARLYELLRQVAVPEMGADAVSQTSTQDRSPPPPPPVTTTTATTTSLSKELVEVLQSLQTDPAQIIQTVLLHSLVIKTRQLEKAIHFLEKR